MATSAALRSMMFLLCTSICLSGACARPGPRCQELLASDDFERASGSCLREFEKSKTTEAAVGAAYAMFRLGQTAELVRFKDRLQGHPSAAADAAVLLAGSMQAEGDAEGAGEVLKEALQIQEGLEDHRGAAQTLYRLFYLSWNQSDLVDAYQYVRQSVDTADLAEDDAQLSMSLQGLFTINYEVGDLAAAALALDEAERSVPDPSPIERFHLLANRGVVLLHQRRPRLAANSISAALQAATDADLTLDRDLLRSSHLNLVEAFLAIDDVEAASRALDQAKEQVDPSSPEALAALEAQLLLAQERPKDAAETLASVLAREPDAEWVPELEALFGDALVATAEFKAAEEAYLRGVEAVEQLQSQLGFDQLKLWVTEKHRRPVEGLFDLLVQNGDSIGALAAIDQLKTRSFIDAFLVGDTFGRDPQPAVDQGGGLSHAVDARQRAVTDLLPELTELPLLQPSTFAKISPLLDGSEGWVFFEAKSRLWRLRAGDNDVTVQEIGATREVRQRVDELLAAISSTSDEEQRLATDLGEILLPKDLPESGRIYVVTDGSLSRLPFAALRVSGQPLVAKLEVAYLPSLSSLVALAARRTHPAKSTGTHVVVDPLGNLGGASAEGTEVSRLLQGTLSVGEHADIESLLTSSGADLLHLATHTGLSATGPWIELADGRVDLSTILSQRVAPRRVVLASCASARGTGAGPWGTLGSAFLAAGSQSVVATLWSVEDEAAHDLVLEFYGSRGAFEPGSALARAQRTLIRRGRATRDWAGFVHLGL